MKTILLENVRGLGKQYEVREAKDGYARNFLFPNKLAEPATPAALKKLEIFKAKRDKNEKELIKKLEQEARKINETALEFYLKTDESGSVFGSVSKEAILKGMRGAKFITKEHVSIDLDRPIKELGEHVVAVDLKKGIKAKLKIIVRKQE